MNQDPNQDQQHPFFPEEEMPVPYQDIPDAPELPIEEPFPVESLSEEHTGGAFAIPDTQSSVDISEDTENSSPTYHGKFSARQTEATEPAVPETDAIWDNPDVSGYQESPTGATSEDVASFQPAEPIAEEFSPAPVRRTRAVKKGRPRRKKGEGLFGIPNILVTGVWIALVVLISVTLGRIAWVCASEILAFGREDRTVTITIYETDTMDDIIKKLTKNELIYYPGLFKLYAQFAVDEGEIKPGIWDLNTKYDYHALVKMMSPSSSREVVKVMIPEGYTCRQIFALLEENKVCTVQDMESYASTGELNDYWFLDGVARGERYCLEGFLFPDTYEFYQNDTPKNVLTKMLNRFDNQFDDDMRGKIQTLNAHLTDLMRRNGKTQDYIDSHLFTVRDVVNVASMIEKETSSAQEGHTIASVIYNRLFCWGTNPAYLNIDATIVYALEGKTDLTAEDLRVDSPYNTYTNIGLTPGPISNPGLSSLQAALEPNDTNYYFYVLDPTAGSHVFSTTQAEHDANRERLGV